MTITVEATYENGVLKPSKPLGLKERDTVQVTIHSGVSWVQQSAGLVRWTGDHDTLRRLAEHVEFDPQEGA